MEPSSHALENSPPNSPQKACAIKNSACFVTQLVQQSAIWTSCQESPGGNRAGLLHVAFATAGSHPMVIAMCGHPMLSVKGALDRCLSQGAQSAVHPDRDLLFRLCYPPVIFGRFSDLSWVFSGLSFCHPLYSDLQVVECTPVETHLFPACFRLLFSRFFRFFADISKAVMRFRCYLQRFTTATMVGCTP